ncbi:hypothetical protein N8I77_008581 [Diaporthe amygdali]|uniref:SET domain-containing protein n=1 Tax=Phomopsis amygdali TaxID=1214568 RepID=A0AAD9W4K5_PHOAM|nr:hypothetical protein N8I77_008581 [Diaporthe amygdali]
MILFQISTRRFSMWLVALMLLPRALSLQDFVFKEKSNFVLPLSALQLTCPAGSQQQSTSNEQENTLPIWEMKLSPGKGRGLFALEDIQKGTHILVEAPLLAVNPPALVPGMGYSLSAMAADVEHEYSRLSPEQQEEYLSCHEQRLEGDSQSESGRLMAILRSNAYNLQDGRVAIYPKVALINHSCQPNVLNADNDGTRVIVATRNIEKGEEILTTYIPLLMDTESRNQRLHPYGFRCDCQACRTGSSDKRRVRAGNDLRELESALQSSGKKTKFARNKLMSTAQALAEYVEEEGLADYYVKTSRLALDHAAMAQNKSNARKWGKRHLEHHEMVDGNSHGAQQAQRLLDSL